MASTQPNVDFDDLAGYHKPLPDRPLSEEEFVAWCDEDVKAEWVDGRVIVGAPPSFVHADLTAFLLCLLSMFVEDHGLGQVLGARLLARLNPRSLRMPDLLFVDTENSHRLRSTHLEGPPDLVIEIVSPDSVERDWREKYYDYQAASVREYWIVDPTHQRLQAYRLVDGAYQRLVHDQGRVASSVLGGFYLREEWLWRAELPKVRDALQEIESAN
jgi:Uma2 family endonuclease